MDIVTDSTELNKRISALKDEEFVAVDTEFMRERTYYPLLCLVQIASSKDAFAIDPLADSIDLSPLYELFANNKIMKVFHACQQDMEIIFHESGAIPSPVFDTQVASQMLGYGESASYAALVKKICDVDLDKSSRFTDWSKRPLSKKQVDYAISDVTHLREVYKNVVEHMHDLGREAWVEGEMKNITDVKSYTVDPETAWTRLKLRGGSQRFLAIVVELAKWRELKAQKINKPREWVLKSDSILEIAAATPKNVEELTGLRGYRGNNNEMAEELIKIVEQGKKAKAPKLIKKKPLPKGIEPLIDLLKVLLKMQCEKQHVAPSVVAKVDDLKELATQENPEIPAMRGWRYDMFGKYAVALKNGKLALAADKNEIILIEPAFE